MRGLEIRGSGTDLETMDSGIFATEIAKGAVIEDNVVAENLYGVYIHGAEDSMTRGTGSSASGRADSAKRETA